MAILCGGLATRMRPLTGNIPKSMLEVAGEPFIAHQLRLLVGAGFREVVLLCGFLGKQIENFVKDGGPFGCHISYSYDGPNLLGTGGAVRRALPLLGEEFMLIYGDSYCPANYRSIYGAFEASGSPALMTVFHNADRWDRSNVEYRDGRVIRYDKTAVDGSMTYIDYGVSAFKSGIFATKSPHLAFDLSGVQQELVAAGNLAGFEVSERFYEIGSTTGLAETDTMLRALRSGPNSLS
jgi:NDP-sugar pyrophosphorylase family protein